MVKYNTLTAHRHPLIAEEALGLLMLCSGLGSIISLPVSGWLCMRFGAKRVVYFSGFLMSFALLAISLMVNLWLTAAMLMIFGGCTISIDAAALKSPRQR